MKAIKVSTNKRQSMIPSSMMSSPESSIIVSGSCKDFSGVIPYPVCIELATEHGEEIVALSPDGVKELISLLLRTL